MPGGKKVAAEWPLAWMDINPPPSQEDLLALKALQASWTLGQ